MLDIRKELDLTLCFDSATAAASNKDPITVVKSFFHGNISHLHVAATTRESEH